ncbi:MAG: T9SS type A sorting domain-containing protein [Chloroflexi bacterium]|nr:T9SS type A sorting domain-containing protein [Chloroflexota bacterium]
MAFNDDDATCTIGGAPYYRSTFTYNLVAGQSYVLQVEGFSTNAGPYELTVTGDCVTVDAQDAPVAFSLGQNVPNPFNPTTTISFSMPETGAASLMVFDVAGRTVATLIDGAVERGQHTVTFDAGNLTSGVYFYTLETNGSVETRKMILMK